MVKDRGRTSLTLWLNFDPSLCCLWNSGPERHRHRLGLRKTRAFKFFQPQFCQYYWRSSFFLIFLKKDVIRPLPRVVTSRAKEKIPSMQDLPIQSAIVTPKAGSIVELDDIEANVRFFSFPFCIVCVFRCLFLLSIFARLRPICLTLSYFDFGNAYVFFRDWLVKYVLSPPCNPCFYEWSYHIAIFQNLSVAGQRLCMEWRW